MTPFTDLRNGVDESRFGGKAAQLGAALGAGLPVPGGVAVAWDALDHEDAAALAARIAERIDVTRGVAVRSSAVGEDSQTASFAGQHATVLGLRTVPGVARAMQAVRASAFTPAAHAYRKKLGLDENPRMGIVVQSLVQADVAGVLFTRHPLTGADERVIEASWGLGEAVVAGLVTPDGFRMERGGRVLERRVGEKDRAIRWSPGGEGTIETDVAAELIDVLCLDDDALQSLEALATSCERVFGGTQDLEWAIEGGRTFLLQRRAITRGHG